MTVVDGRSVQIRHVPDDVHTVLRKRAAAEGKSLQEYLLALLIKEASRPTVAEVLERAGGRSGGRVGLARAAEYIRRDRDSR
jgi:plasmid stability protein